TPVQTGLVFTPSSRRINLAADTGGQDFTAVTSTTPLIGLPIKPPTVTGGATAVGTITLGAPAPSPARTTVHVAGDDPNVTVPLFVTVPANQRSATFQITTVPVTTPETATIQAILGNNTVSATLTLVPSTLVSVSITPTSVTGGDTATGTVTLAGAAPLGGTF